MVRETGIRPHVAPVQVSAAYAGFTRIDFKGSHDRGELDTCHAKPIRRIEQHLGFYFTSFSRMASEVAQEQAKTTPHKERELNAMLQLVDEAESTVRTRKPSVCEVGRMLHESCQIKRPLTQKITNRNIDEIYNLGPSSGALGGTAGGRAAADSCCSWYRRSGIGRPRLAEESAVWGFLFFNKGSHGAAYEPEAPAQERSPIYA